ncbi:MAG: hypothetical protein Q8K58_11880 [Acidimicrobiales bacterium]|nr:hypothetical protein [Acidimicrobiales bacterium]
MIKKHRIVAVGTVCLLLATIEPGPVQAQTAGAEAPDSFNVDIAATPLLIEISAPAALPLDALAGIAYSQVGVNSQPRVQSTAAPAFVPLASDVGLLGGPAGVLSTVIRLAPGLVVGIPTLFGLDPIPVDPSTVNVGPLAQLANGLPIPNAPPLGCTSYFPDVPREAECGGPVQDFFGFRLGAGSARTVSEGDEADPASLASRSDASVVGLGPTADLPLVPFRAGTVASTAESKVVDGRITASAVGEVEEIDIAGGLTISGVKTSFAAAMGGTAETLQQTPLSCEVGAVRLAGQRIALDQDGIILGDTSTPSPADPLVDIVTDVLGSVGAPPEVADFGSITITPNPPPISEVSDDGTQLSHRFGCLEIRYRIAASGTDVKLTVGHLAVTMSAFTDAPLAGLTGDEGASTPDFGDSTNVPSATSGAELGLSDLGLPELTEPGSNAPPASDEAFSNTSGESLAVGWGIDGGWFAPFSLLAMSLPLLARSRRLALSRPHPLRRR